MTKHFGSRIVNNVATSDFYPNTNGVDDILSYQVDVNTGDLYYARWTGETTVKIGVFKPAGGSFESSSNIGAVISASDSMYIALNRDASKIFVIYRASTDNGIKITSIPTATLAGWTTSSSLSGSGQSTDKALSIYVDQYEKIFFTAYITTADQTRLYWTTGVNVDPSYININLLQGSKYPVAYMAKGMLYFFKYINASECGFAKATWTGSTFTTSMLGTTTTLTDLKDIVYTPNGKAIGLSVASDGTSKITIHNGTAYETDINLTAATMNGISGRKQFSSMTTDKDSNIHLCHNDGTNKGYFILLASNSYDPALATFCGERGVMGLFQCDMKGFKNSRHGITGNS
jgi:hypothetical protein